MNSGSGPLCLQVLPQHQRKALLSESGDTSATVSYVLHVLRPCGCAIGLNYVGPSWKKSKVPPDSLAAPRLGRVIPQGKVEAEREEESGCTHQGRGPELSLTCSSAAVLSCGRVC